MNGTKKMINIARVITAKWCEKVGFGKTPLNKHSQCDIYSGARFVPERAWHKTTTFINAPAVGVKQAKNEQIAAVL